MDRNPVLQDLHTFHNPASSTGTNYQDKMTDNMFVMSNNSTISNASDTQSTASFLDALDFTNFDSKFYQPPVQEQQIQHQQSQPQQQQQQQQQQNQNQAQSQHQNQNQNQNINQNINQNQRLQELQSYANQLQLNRQQFHDIQQQQQQQQHHQQQQHQQQQQQTQQQQHIHHQHQPQQHHHSQQVYSPNAYYQQQQLHHLQQQQQHQQQYLPVYAGTPQQQQQQHNQILLQRFNSNGSTTSSTNSQPSYISNYSPMAHYSQSLQQQEQAGVNKIYFSNNDYQQQQIQVPVSLTKKRKINVGGTELLEETLSVQKKKTKAKKKKVPKVVDPNAPPKPKRKTGLNKPLILSDALSELMDGDKELSRPELVQKLWKYIKSNDLQDPADRRFILCDAKLKKIFDQDRINSFGMNKDLSAHLTKKEEPIITQVTIETSESVTKDIVQQEPTPSEDNNTNEDDFLL